MIEETPVVQMPIGPFILIGGLFLLFAVLFINKINEINALEPNLRKLQSNSNQTKQE